MFEEEALDLTGLLSVIEEMPPYRRLMDKLKQRGNGTGVTVLDAAKPYLVAALYRGLKLPMLAVAARPENAKKLYEQISTWCGGSQVKYFPSPDAMPYERIVADASTEMERVQVLALLTGCGQKDNAPLIVTSAAALMGKVPEQSGFTKACHVIAVGTNIDPLSLLGRWEGMGYRAE